MRRLKCSCFSAGISCNSSVNAKLLILLFYMPKRWRSNSRLDLFFNNDARAICCVCRRFSKVARRATCVTSLTDIQWFFHFELLKGNGNYSSLFLLSRMRSRKGSQLGVYVCMYVRICVCVCVQLRFILHYLLTNCRLTIDFPQKKCEFLCLLFLSSWLYVTLELPLSLSFLYEFGCFSEKKKKIRVIITFQTPTCVLLGVLFGVVERLRETTYPRSRTQRCSIRLTTGFLRRIKNRRRRLHWQQKEVLNHLLVRCCPFSALPAIFSILLGRRFKIWMLGLI